MAKVLSKKAASTYKSSAGTTTRASRQAVRDREGEVNDLSRKESEYRELLPLYVRTVGHLSI